MPLSHSKVEQATAEDLAELSEIERHNLGQVLNLSNYLQHIVIFSQVTLMGGVYKCCSMSHYCNASPMVNFHS